MNQTQSQENGKRSDGTIIEEWGTVINLSGEKVMCKKGKLITLSGEKKDSEHIISEKGASIGRDSGNDIRLTSQTVSRNHARIDVRGQRFFIIDKGSSNKTKVNGKNVCETELQNGDLVSFGLVDLRFILFDSPQGKDSTPKSRIQGKKPFILIGLLSLLTVTLTGAYVFRTFSSSKEDIPEPQKPTQTANIANSGLPELLDEKEEPVVMENTTKADESTKNEYPKSEPPKALPVSKTKSESSVHQKTKGKVNNSPTKEGEESPKKTEKRSPEVASTMKNELASTPSGQTPLVEPEKTNNSSSQASSKRMRELYLEAYVLEGVDRESAAEKWEEILAMGKDSDEYFKKAQEKLKTTTR